MPNVLQPALLSLVNIELKRNQHLLLSKLSADFNAHDLIHVQGVNGAGKTTLLRCLTSLTELNAGNIYFKGEDIHDLMHIYHQQFLYIGHSLGLKEDLTPLENLKALLGIRGQDIDIKKIIRVLNSLGLKNTQRPLRQLSSGQRRRVALARLFLEDCPIWFLDEPFTALDIQTISLLENALDKHCKNGGLVIMTSHQALSAHLNARTFKIGIDKCKS